MHLPGPVLRGDEGPRGGVPAICDGGVQERDGGAVRAGQLGVHGGPGVLGGTGLLPDVLQTDAARRGVHGAVPQLGGDTPAAREGVQDEPVQVHRKVGGRLSAPEGAHGQAVLRRRGGSASPTAAGGH